MNLRTQKREDPEVNLTPLIDVVFLLLIFFMVTTSFIRESAVSLQLPTATSEPSPGDPPSVEVRIDADGRYYFGDSEVIGATRSALRRALLVQAEHDTERVLIIRADARAPHQSVITVMDVAGREGFARISMVTAQEDDE